MTSNLLRCAPFFRLLSFSVFSSTKPSILRLCSSPHPHFSTLPRLAISSRALSAACLDNPKAEKRQLEELLCADDGEEDEAGYGDLSGSHIPVLLTEVMAAFQDAQLQAFVDCTLGAAGHASSIIKSHRELKTFVGLDVDPVARSVASTKLQEALESRKRGAAPDLSVHVLEANFKDVKSALHGLGLAQEVDGILMDLGMSSMQLNGAERGFGLQQDGPLDMRMDPRATLMASDILNGWPESEIGRVIRDYGEERHWKRLAKKISEAQLSGGIHSTSALLELIQRSLPSRFLPGRAGWKKTAIRVFQALRIAVNDELSALKAALPDAFECLRPKGRLVVISFHSLEDRIVKQFFLKAMGEPLGKSQKDAKYASSSTSRDDRMDEGSGGESKGRGNKVREGTRHDHRDEEEKQTRGNKVLEGTCASVLTKRPLTAGLDEVKENSRARSAKLRILVKK